MVQKNIQNKIPRKVLGSFGLLLACLGLLLAALGLAKAQESKFKQIKMKTIVNVHIHMHTEAIESVLL